MTLPDRAPAEASSLVERLVSTGETVRVLAPATREAYTPSEAD